MVTRKLHSLTLRSFPCATRQLGPHPIDHNHELTSIRSRITSHSQPCTWHYSCYCNAGAISCLTLQVSVAVSTCVAPPRVRTHVNTKMAANIQFHGGFQAFPHTSVYFMDTVKQPLSIHNLLPANTLIYSKVIFKKSKKRFAW